MPFNTGNPVPSSNAKDLSDNAANLDSAVNSQEPTWVDRLGVTRDTVKGSTDVIDTAAAQGLIAIADDVTQVNNAADAFEILALDRVNKIGVLYDSPIRPWSAGLLVDDLRAHRRPDGEIVIPKKALPFTTGAAFNTDYWNLLQGITDADLINDLSQSYIFPTVAAFKESPVKFLDKKIIKITSTGSTEWSVTSGEVGNNNDIIQGVNNQIKKAKTIIDATLFNLGYTIAGYFVEGFTYIKNTDVGIDGDGVAWRYVGVDAPFKVVPPGSIAQSPKYKKITANVDATYGYSVWTPPTQPDYSDAWIPSPWIASKYISDLWEPLRLENTDYITRSLLGQDASGSYPVYRYVFEPENYIKTVILIANVHGAEIMGQLAAFQFLKSVTEGWRDNAQLAYMRQRVRIVIIPIVNPWGLTKNIKRYNANNVDINRNFDYKWDEYVDPGTPGFGGKGVSAFSELETQYVRDTIAEFSDAVAFMDLHDFTAGGNTTVYPCYIPAEHASGSEMATKVISSLRKGTEKVLLQRSYYPFSINYATDTWRINSVNPEFAPGLKDTAYGPGDVWYATRWFGNMIMAYSQAGQGNKEYTETEGRCWFNTSYQGGSTNITSTTYEEVAGLTKTYTMPNVGYLKIAGTITVSAGLAGDIIYLTPKIGQTGYGRFGEGDDNEWVLPDSDKTTELEVYVQSAMDGQRLTIPFNAVIPVNKTTIIAGDVTVGIMMKVSTGGSAKIFRYRCVSEFVNSSLGDSRVLIHAAGGQLYPKN